MAKNLHLERAKLKRSLVRQVSINSEATWENSPFLKKKKVTFDRDAFVSVCEVPVRFPDENSITKASFNDLKAEVDAHSITCRRTTPAHREKLLAHYRQKHSWKKNSKQKRKKKKPHANFLSANKKTKHVHVKQEPEVKVENHT